MTPFEKRYQKFLENNPDSELTFEDWKKNILSQSDLIKEHRDNIMEIQKMAEKLLDKQNK
jgi:hypothetical protein